MVLPSIISIIPPTTCFALIIIIAFLGWNDRGIKLLLLLLTVLTAYGIFDVIIQNQDNIESVADLIRFRTALWGIIPPLSYHTVIALMKSKGRRWILTYLYTAGGVLIVLFLNGFSVFSEYYLTWWGWNAVMNPDSFIFWLLHGYLVSGVAAFIITLIEIRRQTENYRVRKLANAILIHFIWGGSFTIIPYFILASFNIPTEILLTYAGNVAMFLIVYAVLKYQPEKFSAVKLFSTLGSLIPVEAITISNEKKIIWISREKLVFNGLLREELEGCRYEKLFVDVAAIEEEMDKVRTIPNYSASLETECYTHKGNTTKIRISISGLRNQFNDITAFFIVFNKLIDNTELLECLQLSYELSTREKEVASLLLKEYSNIQICDTLFISLNTVKTHTRNIYLKTNTANRNEFKRFCENLSKRLECNTAIPE